ncbi:hypothetical protein PF010_g22268 [Phytophthora fragariae]|uniref:Glycoside hydrolase family 5 domain-containing protein n=1 Tax=Phytophthora fragariae TaxID=53985 RepID=A0A6G0K9S7_9STRA|nr:hypothetical protein PF010_g22268 [Phytophthora fragariae]KAE9191400.1 hypothetical protein PF004_g21615 [Phytophthora fragariae]
MTARLRFEAARGGVWLDGKPFFLKGASFFGMESDICVPHGLWGGDDSTTLAVVAQLLRSNGFNLVRVPLAVAAAVNNIPVDRYKMCNETALLRAFEGKELRYLDVLDYMVHELARHELLVLLDAHVMQPAGAITPLWYDSAQGCPESVVTQMWTTLATRYAEQWNVLGADLNNEPHGEATWGSGVVRTDWRLAAMRLAETVLAVCPQWLIFVEGVQTTSCDVGHEVPCFWGENLQAAVKHPVKLSVDHRLVYCPHTYGPAVSWQPYFNAEDFPNNMPRVWDTHFGFLKHQSEVPLVIGEWGGCHANPKDWSWQNRFAEYVQQIGVSGVVFWCVNPNGGDTDGLLRADWRTPNAEAFQLLSRFAGTPLSPSLC